MRFSTTVPAKGATSGKCDRRCLGADGRIAVDAYPGETFQGKVTYVSDLLDEVTRTAKARVEIPNPERRLKPGMFVTATLSVPAPRTSAVTAIPEAAVYQIRGKPVVFIQESERVFAVRDVRLGQRAASYVEVLDGVREGEQVVTEGGFALKSTLLKEEMGEEHEE